jgi:hypothetical protein
MSDPLPIPLTLLTHCLREVFGQRVDLRAIYERNAARVIEQAG